MSASDNNMNSQIIDGENDNGKKDSDSPTPPMPDPQEDIGNPTLSEELRRMQKRLAEIDHQTQTSPEGLLRANLIDSIFQGKEMFNTGQYPGVPLGAPPYFTPTLLIEHNQLASAQQRLSQLVLTNDERFDPVTRYLQFERARMEVKHRQEKILVMLTEAGFRRGPRIPPMPGSTPGPMPGHTYGPKGDIGKADNQSAINEADGDPIVSYLSWNAFKARASRSGVPIRDSVVIEVLDGEPILPDTYFGTSYIHEKAPIPQFENEPDSRDPAVLGQNPLPERIRIRSVALLTVIGKVSDNNRPNADSAVMVRPFKFLSFYQNQLREWYNKLDAKFSPKINIEENKVAENVPSQTSGVSASETGVTEAGPKTDIRAKDSTATGLVKGVQVITVQSDEDIIMSLTAFTHLRCLLEFVDKTIVVKQKNLREHCKKVSFVDLWHLFKPGDEVVEFGDKYMQCYKVVNVTSPKHNVTPRYFYSFFPSKGKGETVVSVHCVYVDFDGSVLGPVSKRFDIARYKGLKEITSLPVYPLSHSKNSTSIRQNLIDRGNKFLKVLQVGHMHYNGLTLESRDEVDSQVVVDFTEALAHREDRRNAGWKPKVQLRSEMIHENDNESNDRSSTVDPDENGGSDNEGGCTAECCEDDFVYDDNYVDQKQNEEFLSKLLGDTDEDENPAPLAVMARNFSRDRITSITDDDKVIMTYRVFGFVLRSRSWAKLNIQELMDLEEYKRKKEKETPTEQKENAFDNLVFPKDGLDRKTIVRSLVAQHFRDRESGSRDEQSDIIRGKGKGLIILLHGAPGVGKTTTAEGIAELFNRPLFQITCGDLGTTAREVESALETNFALANKWGSILLLDEADVFLARRTPQDFKRNGLVAVFLRVLEYYAGILFLTTNRIGDFDEAFSSRIHISLHYPALDYNSTIEIFELNWRLMKARFTHKNRTLDIDTVKITGFIADYWHNQKDARWNGRQIRNACQTALALAEFEAHGTNEKKSGDDDTIVHLGVSHMETVANAYLEFTKYLQDVRDVDQERYGYLMGIRRREGKGTAPEDLSSYNPSSSFRSGHLSPLAEQRARLAARYNRQEPVSYQQGYNTPYTPDRQGQRYGSSLGAPSPSLYQPYTGQPQRGGPYQPSPEPQAQQGWNPRAMGGYFAGTQDTQQPQGSSQGQDAFPPQGQYGQYAQE
ncbi:hypothetical protein F4805DRAFT_456837 [Annulohypoxylon moriforme]|nr:hypothetical protein F4805DRAFT_456837 [Annulohypoxylon moriforme]